MNEQLDDFMTINDFCKVYKVTRPTVYKMIKTGEMKIIRVSNQIRIPKDWRNLDEN